MCGICWKHTFCSIMLLYSDSTFFMSLKFMQFINILFFSIVPDGRCETVELQHSEDVFTCCCVFALIYSFAKRSIFNSLIYVISLCDDNINFCSDFNNCIDG